MYIYIQENTFSNICKISAILCRLQCDTLRPTYMGESWVQWTDVSYSLGIQHFVTGIQRLIQVIMYLSENTKSFI